MKSQTYGALHKRMRRRISKPEFCECCGKNPPQDLANISQKYKDDVSDWEWLCRSCHMQKDGRIIELQKHKPMGIRNHFWMGGKLNKLICLCGKVFYKYQSRIIKGRNNYCSGSCRNKFRTHELANYNFI